MKTIEPGLGKAKKQVAFGAAGISVFLHLGLLLLVGGVVVVEYAVPRSTMTGELSPVMSEDSSPTAEETPEPVGEPEAPDAPSESAAAPSENTPVDLNVSTIDVLSVHTPTSSFQMPAAMGAPGGGSGTPSAAGGAGGGGKGGKPGRISNPFGGAERLDKGSMEGIFYDLKQTVDRKPSGMDRDKYLVLLEDFFKRGWNRRMLEKYYRVRNPLYTSQIYMPLMNANEAPKAFHVENEVQPAQWIILYEGQFQAPESGQYRFAGYADDMLVVRVNDRVVLDGSIITARANNKPVENPVVKVPGQEVAAAHKIGNGSLIYSDWMHFDADQANKIEILVGERPGGQFCAFLFVEDREKSRTYKKDANGRPILPLFRTADVEAPSPSGDEFLKDGPVFGVK